MHRDVITHAVCTKTDFLITASTDGHVKFWKKQEQGLEFVKHFRAHLGRITAVAVTSDGLLMCTAAQDKALKVFDVLNFDMINMLRLGYVPLACVWLYAGGAATAALACCEQETPLVHVYDGHGDSSELAVLDSLHSSPLTFIEYNSQFDAVVSGDQAGMLEYWSGPSTDYSFPKCVLFQHKLDTDLYEFVKHKATPLRLTFSPSGKVFAVMASDRKVRLFHFLTGKLYLIFDESLQLYSDLQQVRNRNL
jgi:peptidylprolyl isomerase domain and WD repeat-containing protein 1